MDYLEGSEVKESQFYGLPKIHKSQAIINQCEHKNSSYVEVEDVNVLKIRPIVAGPSCLTHRLSNLLDIILRPFTNHKVTCEIQETFLIIYQIQFQPIPY